jgi:hypothetical protein
MPECLNNQEGIFPGRYDPLYDQTINPFEPGSPDFDEYLQSISREILGRLLSPEKLSDLKAELDSKGYLNMNKGDPAFRDAVIKILNKIKLAGKVVYAYRIK